tara:strand:+ start:75 stop:362 length:288 start_codon:yes stop_codon:yes gene_type:complete
MSKKVTFEINEEDLRPVLTKVLDLLLNRFQNNHAKILTDLGPKLATATKKEIVEYLEEVLVNFGKTSAEIQEVASLLDYIEPVPEKEEKIKDTED